MEFIIRENIIPFTNINLALFALCYFKPYNIYIDYDYWLRALHHTNCAYVKYICIYYDDGHGDGNDF
jgi:hypothetical protein